MDFSFGLSSEQKNYASEVNIPEITEHPQSVKTLYGSTVTFSVKATGENLTYNWQYKPNIRNGTWTNAGVTKSTYTVTASSNDEYLYRCLVSNDVYSGDSAIQSDVACLYINRDQVYRVQYITETPTAPKITKQPLPAQAVMGEKVTFTIEAEGENLSYQWQYKPSVTNGTWTNVSNSQGTAQNQEFTTVPLTYDNTGYEYRCIVRDEDGYYYGDQNAVVSDTASVRVIPQGYTSVVYINESYNITDHPQTVLTFSGESATFKVKAEGNTTLTYRWLYKTTDENSTWTEVPTSMATGTQTDTLVINKVLDDYDGYMFRCSVGGSIYVYEKSLLSNIAYLLTIQPEQKISVMVDTTKMMITEWTIPAGGAEIKLPVAGNVDLVIDWGDGQTTAVSGEIGPDTFPTHTYTNTEEKKYDISIVGTCPVWGYSSDKAPTESGDNSAYYTYTQYLTGLKQWGELGAKQYGFAQCANLKYVSGDAGKNSFANLNTMDHMFNGCTSLESLDLRNFDTSNVWNMSYAFENCSNLKTLDLSSFDTGKVQHMAVMFYGCTGLESLDVSNFNTENLTGTRSMFQDCKSLTTLDVSNFDVSEVGNMEFMFKGCEKLESLNVDGFYPKVAVKVSGIFADCTSLTTLDISKFNTENVTTMERMFQNCSSLVDLNLDNINTSNVTNMISMFEGCGSLTNIDLSNFDTADVTKMDSMFRGCKGLTELDVSALDTSDVTSMVAMFANCPNLTSLDLSTFDTTNVTSFDQMFIWCTNLKSVNLSSFNTGNATNMHRMFYDTGLEHIDLSNFDTSKVTNMQDMFRNTDVETVDMSSFDTSSVNNMSGMYLHASNLKSILISEKFIISGDATNIFYEANNLSAIITVSSSPVPNQFNGIIPSGVTLYVPNGSEAAYAEALSGDSSVTVAPIVQPNGEANIVLNIGSDYADAGYTVAGFTAAESDAYTVYGFAVITSGDVNTYVEGTYQYTYDLTRTYTSGDESITTDPMQAIRIIEVVDKTSYMITEWTIPVGGAEVKLPVQGNGLDITIDWGDGTITKVSGDLTEDDFPTHTYTNTDEQKFDIAIRGNCPEVGYSLDTEVPESGYRSEYYTFTQYVTGLKQWGRLNATRYGFSRCVNLKYVSGDAVSDTFTNVTSMAYMFNKCTSLESVDLSKFKTSTVTDMSFMFNECSKLTSLNVSSLDTSNVTGMSAMFKGCSGLTNLNVSNFNTSEVTSMSNMFGGCSKLTELNLTNFDTAKVGSMSFMFDNCKELKNLYISKFNTSSVKTMERMFYQCSNLTSLDVSSFNTSDVNSMPGMFSYCSKLTNLDLSNFDTSNVTNMNGMFNYCINLTQLDVSNFDTSNVEGMRIMFRNCQNLTELNLSSFDTSNVTDMYQMFSGDTSLESILISNKFVVPASGENMFANTPNLDTIIITSEETNGSQFATVKDQMDGKIFYVPNKSVEAYREAFSADFSGDRIQPILELLGDEKVSILKGNPYEEKNYTVAGFGIDEPENYFVYGYNVTINGDVNTKQSDEYTLEYILTRTYENLSGDTVEEKNIATRIVTVYDTPIITLYENGELYDGEWTKNDVVGVMQLLAPESEWIAVKVGNSEWTQNPSYGEIKNSGDVMTITFTQSMGEYIYVREIDEAGHATTYETPGDMVKIDKEAPEIKNLKAVTEDGTLSIKAIVSDNVSGVSNYTVTTTDQVPTYWEEYTGGEISHPVATSGTYYLWIKDKAGNTAGGYITARKDVEPPKGLIEIEATNILSGDVYSDIIVVAPDRISGEKYTNKDVVKINIYVTDNESVRKRIMFALYGEEDYEKVKNGEQEIEWQQYTSQVEWPLKEEQGQNIIYAIFKDVAGNMTIKTVEYQEP